MSILEDLQLDGLPLNGFGDNLTNLVPNPGAEVNVTGWAGVNATVARTITYADTGVASFLLTATTTGAIQLNHSGARFGVTPGLPYSAATMVRTVSAPRPVTALLDFYDAGGVRVSVTSGPALSGSTTVFGRAAVENIVAPVGAVTGQVNTNVAGVLAVGEQHVVDSVIAVQGTTAPAFFDGSFPGYYWLGAANNSASASSPFSLESVDLTPPPELEEWIKGADSDGALLAREPKCDNRVIEAHIRVEPQASKDVALAKIALLVDKLKECQRQPIGLALVWRPANATLPAVTFRCLSGQVTAMPIDVENGWMVNAPLLTVKLTCLPFGEGVETQLATVTSSAPIITQELTGVAGDVPALGRLVVTDAASKDRRYLMWGLESRYYPTTSPPSLIVDSSAMVTTGYSGVTATRTAAYSGATNNVIGVTARTVSQAVCGLGNLSHVGSFRPQLRFYASATTLALRLSFKSLDGPLRSLSYKVPVAVGFNHVDLGVVSIPEAQAGTQRWTGQIEVYSTGTGGESFQVDAMWLMPAELFARVRGTYSYQPGPLAAFDDFAGITAGTSLGTRTAPVGGAWAGSGHATDFVAADAPNATDETLTRTIATDGGVPRYAVLGATRTDTEVGVDIRMSLTSVAAGGMSLSALARWVDTANWARVSVSQSSSSFRLEAAVVVANALTVVSSVPITVVRDTWYRIRAVVYASGTIRGTITDSAGVVVGSTVGWHAALATGGALATGKPGFSDQDASSVGKTRYYDNFYASTPSPEPVVLYSGRTIEFRDDATLRQDSTGTYYGPPPDGGIGPRFFIPPAGGPGRKARVAVIARRNDIETSTDDDLVSNATTDSTTLTVFATPRYIVVPR